MCHFWYVNYFVPVHYSPRVYTYLTLNKDVQKPEFKTKNTLQQAGMIKTFSMLDKCSDKYDNFGNILTDSVIVRENKFCFSIAKS